MYIGYDGLQAITRNPAVAFDPSTRGVGCISICLANTGAGTAIRSLSTH
ncbi:MAG: hypothetical protein Q8M95_02450 [Candidatus Methanoperedens sp.]|nr:hypothetical protein [Candidatus Methanoperedens sp.]